MTDQALYLWACDLCCVSVFMPKRHAGKVLTGGACTQQKRGCPGKLRRCDADEQAAAIERVKQRGLKLQPWLTLIFSRESVDAAKRMVREAPDV